MPTDTRVRRVAERIRNDLAEVLQRSASDPRLEGLTVTDVEVDRELAFATIFVTALEGEQRRDGDPRGSAARLRVPADRPGAAHPPAGVSPTPLPLGQVLRAGDAHRRPAEVGA